MGMFCRVTVADEIDLPHFPEELDHNIGWQSKQGLDVYDGSYRITADGRLEKHQQSYREKTDEEKQAEAEKWGFDSWDSYVQAYDEMDGGSLFPDAVDWDKGDDSYDEAPPVHPSSETVDEEWWGDQSFHGTFEFHSVLKRDPRDTEELTNPISDEPIERPCNYALDVFLEYEARFTKGDLDEIVFMGERGFTDGDDPVQSALEAIEEWREWKEEQE